jgi:hypothetical protein
LDDSEQAHLNLKGDQILLYVGASENHKFLLEKEVKLQFTNRLWNKVEGEEKPEEYFYLTKVSLCS